MSLVLTKAALALKHAEDNFKFVKFEAHKPKKKTVNDEKDVKLSQRDSNLKKDQDLKKIRHEVVKFGMSGFDPSKKEEARIALAVQKKDLKKDRPGSKKKRKK
ncbi:hypothetical protein MSG28_000099 [Choristoneura fumiferana]|uniref:Uncharacterized protein n=1 Tax=Choristoneura fumiferana TaxID=7141 RepID=A0ACC0JZD4_CHOFU|nr:hypothetical protein MSG28_000099 [Choristoneura fumiferana]